jgi:hypothetical protein
MPATRSRSTSKRAAPDDMMALTKIGWHVMSRDGHRLGVVVRSGGGAVIVQAKDPAGHTLAIPTQYIREERAAQKLILLQIDAREALVLAEDSPS